MSALRVAITVDALALDPGAAPDVTGVLEAVSAVEASLAELGHASFRVPVGDGARPVLAPLFGSPPDLVFNLCESVQWNGEGEARLIATLELAGIPVTGATAELVTLARRKDVLGALLAGRGIAVPRSRVVADATLPPDWDYYPCIVKPAGEDGSIGIGQDSVARDRQELAAVLQRRREHAPLLLQELLTGRELNIGFIGEHALPIAEIEYRAVPAGFWPIVDYAAKWDAGSITDRMTVPVCPAVLEGGQAEAALAVALAAWQAAGGCGYGRVDLRADDEGRWHVLEVNPNPDLAPSAGLARMAAAGGWSYRELIEQIVAETAARAAVRQITQHALTAREPGAELHIQPLPPAARCGVQRILESTGMFRDDEVVVALEVVDAYLARPGQDYTALGAFTRAGELVGYSCHGPTPCTLGTFDLYWIAVDPTAQRAGVGSALLQEVERRLAQEDARLLLIETSSQPRYLPTRRFYERHGYHEVARVPEFYAPGDDRVIFAKRIHPVRRG
jgi:D-alanine-D-alanine ligase